jgi:tellurite resistance protein TehA-like permease
MSMVLDTMFLTVRDSASAALDGKPRARGSVTTGGAATQPVQAAVSAGRGNPAVRVIDGSARQLLVKLPVSAFTVVMATGVMAIAAAGAGQDDLADVLRWAAVVMLSLLIGLHLTRVLLHRRVTAAELAHPTTAFDAFSIVAALTVTAMALSSVLISGAIIGVWGCAVLIWTVVVAATLGALVRHRRFGLVHFASGRWLLGVVSIESIAVLGVAASIDLHNAAISVAAVIAWAAGLVAYPAVALAIVVRLQRRGWHVIDLTPDHWILMGALAICTLATANVVSSATGMFAGGERSVLAAVTWATWACASAFYVVLAAVTIRRWGVSIAARQSNIHWWASVFPLGMYSACTVALFRMSDIGAQRDLAAVTFWLALGAWTLAACMSARTVTRTLREVR